MVPASLAQWTPAHMLNFALHFAMWEILLIGIPVIVLAVAGWLWWKRIPEEERKEYELFSKRSRAENGGGGISFLLFVAFCLKVYIDGRWNVPIASWTLDYVVESMISLLAWSAIVFGIPAIIIGLIYLSHEIRKS